MTVVANVLVSVAAAVLFLLVEPYLLGLDQPWKSIAALIVVIVACSVAHMLGRAKKAEKLRVLTENEAGKDLRVKADGIEVTSKEGDILSGNKAKGTVVIDVSDSKL